MFATLAELKSESDVEQKLIWRILTETTPIGLGFLPAEIHTKSDIRALPIGKGKSQQQKLYFPDYAIVLGGLPVCIVEAKRPGEDILEALREARLYACELNAQFPSGMNPCIRVIACNGEELASTRWDTSDAELRIPLDSINTATAIYNEFQEIHQRDRLRAYATTILESITQRPFKMPLQIVGGRTVRNEEIGHNSFGATLQTDFQHIFDPASDEERAYIAKHAYVRSLRRDKYAEPIDRLIRAASPPSVSDPKLIENTQQATEINATLTQRKKLEHQVLLLVGGVGAGKSTFIDHFREVAISEELKSSTRWVRLNLNKAPLNKEEAYKWICVEIKERLQALVPEVDWADIATIQKVFGIELRDLKRGVLSLLREDSDAYRDKLVTELLKWKDDPLISAKCTMRYVCGDRGLLAVIVLDNCDKRTRDEQLFMFDLAQWVQSEFQSLVVLPIRDVTYDHHRKEPPLDTALKNLVFRIEPPLFAKVLQKRVALALKEIGANDSSEKLTYMLPNGFKVEYPRSDQGMYLASILKSLYEYDRLIRRTITGLAGRDIREALSLFIEFCTSGHVGEHEIFKIRQSNGNYTLPYPIVVRVLLRMNRRFYEGDSSYIKNIFACDPRDARPDMLARFAILHWMKTMWPEKGPSGVKGYHRASSVIEALVPGGHESEVLRREIAYLVRARCLIAEHQRVDNIQDEDLVALAPAGVVHLELSNNLDYLAACAEESWLDDARLAESIAHRLTNDGVYGHYSRVFTTKNGLDLADYIQAKASQSFPCPNVFLRDGKVFEEEKLIDEFRYMRTKTFRNCIEFLVLNLPWRATELDLEKLFADHVDEVVDAKIITDDNGRSRGSGLIKVKCDDIEKVVHAVSGLTVGGRVVTVKLSNSRFNPLR